MKKKKPIQWFKWIKERRLIKLCIAWAGLLTIISLLLYFFYLFYNKVFLYAPSYTVWLCFSDSIVQDDTRALASIDEISLHTNISVTVLIIFHTFECLLIHALIMLTYDIKDYFNMKAELISVFVVWFLTSFLSIGLFINLDNDPHS